MNRKATFEDWHKVFVQLVMHKGVISGQEMFKAVKNICQTYAGHRKFPKVDVDNKGDVAEIIDELFTQSNKMLKPLQMEIKKGYEEVRSENGHYTQVYVFVSHMPNDSLCKMNKLYAETEFELLKLICKEILSSNDGTCLEIDLQNLCRQGGNNSQKKKLDANTAGAVVKMFIKQGYLTKLQRKKPKITLGTRFRLEMAQWIENTFDLDEESKCTVCKQITVYSARCTKCSRYAFHPHCIEQELRSKGKEEAKCPGCKSRIKIDGVAVKRGVAF